MDVIQAKSAVALKSSLQQLKGSVLRAIKEIRSSILYQIAFIESALDDPEHISLEGYPEKLRKIVNEEYEKVETLLKSAGRRQDDTGRDQDGDTGKTPTPENLLSLISS